MQSAKHIRSDLENRLDPTVLTDDESCFVLSNVTRVAAIKLLGSMSRNAYTALGLDEREITSLEALYRVLQC
jgi:hypothetical protein